MTNIMQLHDENYDAKVKLLADNEASQARIAELEAKLIKQIEYSTMCNQEAINMGHWYETMIERNKELEADNAKLREALGFMVDRDMAQAVDNGANSLSMPDYLVSYALLLSTTPTTSLNKFRNDVIEACALVCDTPNDDGYNRSYTQCMEIIRKLKHSKE